MARALAATVVLRDEDGLPVVLMAGTVPTAEQADQIDNPKVWADESHEDEHDHESHDDDQHDDDEHASDDHESDDDEHDDDEHESHDDE